MPLTDNYPRRRLSAIVERPSTPQGSGYGDLRQWAGHVVEKVRVASIGGRLRFLPWYDPYTEETPEIRAEYRRMLFDDAVKSAFQMKVLSVISQGIQFQPADDDSERDKEVAQFCSYAFKKVRGGTAALGWSVIAHGLIDGHSVCEPVWEDEPIPFGRWKGKRRFRTVKAKDTRYLQLGIDPYRNVTALRGSGFNMGRVWSPSDFTIFTHLPLFENPSGMSDFRAAYRPYVLKDTAMKLWGLFLEKWSAGPYLKGTYTNQEQKNALEEALDKAAASTWLTIPTGVAVEAMELALKGPSDFEAAIDSFNKSILVAIAGAHLMIMEGQTPGGRGNTKVQQSTSELAQWWLSESLATVYREQLAPMLVAENYHAAECPDVSLGAVAEEAMLEMMKVDELFQKLGGLLSKSEFYKRYGRQQPVETDDVLTPPGQGGQGPGGPAPPGGPPMPPGGPDQGGGNGQGDSLPTGRSLSEKEVRQGPVPFGGGSEEQLHDWASMSEADWACFAASDWQPYTVTRGKNKGKQAWKHTKSGRISYEDPAKKEAAKKEADEAKAKAKQEAVARAKAAAAAKVKARQAAIAAKAKAAAAKAKAQEKAKGQRRRAAEHIRDVVSGSATTTPAKVRVAGAHLLNMTATELRALKSEIGAKGGGAAKAGIVQAITERALAARKAGKGKAVPAKPAKPVAKPKPGKEAGPGLTAAAPDNPLLLAMVTAEPDFLTSGAMVSINDIKKALPGVPKEQVDAALLDLVARGVLNGHRHDFPDSPQHTAVYGGKAGMVPDGKGSYLIGFALENRTPEGKAFGAAADPKFTGTDRLGRKWVNGELVAREEKSAAPDDRQRQIDFISDRLGKARAELERAFPHGPQDSQGYRDRAKQVADYQAQLDALGGGKAFRRK